MKPLPRKMLFLILAFVLPRFLSAQAPMPNTDIYVLDIKVAADKFILSKPENITKREGYDNQPCFLPGGLKLLYTSIRANKNADVYEYNIKTKATKQLTNTPEDEYSPTPMQDGVHFSTVRVEKDSSQRLWMFPLAGGTPELVFKSVRRIGYHCWANNTIAALWILGDSLKIGDTRMDMAMYMDTGVGRCVQYIPGDKAFSFVKKRSKTDWMLMRLGLGAGKKSDIVKTLPGSEDYVWTPDGTLLMGNEGKLYKFNPRKDKDWVMIADFKGTELENFYRIAISQEGNKLALVSYKGKKP
jgi:hypothetical protein